MIKNIKIVFAYDGSKFSGMQSQKDKNSIQEELEKAIFKTNGKKSRLVTAGRTDAGVHAYGQVANFLTASNIPAKAYVFHLRKYLPDSIWVISTEEVDLDFHSRFSVHKKKYAYIVYNDKFMHPSLNSIYTHISYNLDVEKMNKACKMLIGRHDFKAFTKYEDKPINTVRSIIDARVYKKDKLVYFEFEAESFLYNQVRIMVGSLIDIGRGHKDTNYINELLELKDRLKAGRTLGPQGLYLMSIKY